MKKKLTILEYELPVLIEEEKEGGFVAQCTLWADCYAQGETLEAAANEISYVASSLIELYREEGLKVPLKLRRTTQKSKTGLNFTFPVIVTN